MLNQSLINEFIPDLVLSACKYVTEFERTDQNKKSEKGNLYIQLINNLTYEQTTICKKYSNGIAISLISFITRNFTFNHASQEFKKRDNVGRIRVGKTIMEKFQAAKACGF